MYGSHYLRPMQMNRLFGWLLFLSCCPFGASSQVFMRAFDPAPAFAMGGASVAYPGLGAGLANEAAPAFQPGWGIWAGSALPYTVEGWSTATLQAYTRIDGNSAAAFDLSHNGTDAYQEQRFRLNYARRLSPRFAFGGSADLFRVAAPEYGSANAASFGLGVLAEPVKNLWLGARIQNPLQIKLGDDILPTTVRIGGAWRSSNALLWLLEAEKDLERPVQVRAGIEYRPIESVVIRAGMRSAPGRMSLGAGFLLKNGLSIHAAAEWHPVLGVTPAAALHFAPPGKQN